MGMLLSLPMILAGIIVMFFAYQFDPHHGRANPKS